MLNPSEFENRSRLKRVGLYLAMLVAVGVGLAIMVYVVQMQLLGWSLGNASFNTSRSLPTPVQLVVYRSPTTARYWASVGGNAEVLWQPWRDFAQTHSIRLTEPTSLNGLSPGAGDVLVLPSLVALDETERQAVLAYQAQGGSVLATWATGSRDGAGVWVGWDFLKALAGVSVVAELPKRADGDVMLMHGQTPVSHGLLAGRAVGLGNVAERPFLLSGAPRAAVALGAEGATVSAGLLLFQEPDPAEPGGAIPGRVVVWGMPETTWDYQPSDVKVLVTNMLLWLTRQPVVVASDWPQGRPGAHMVAVDSAGDWAMATGWVAQLRAAAYPLTLFVPVALAQDNMPSLRGWADQLDVSYRGETALAADGASAAATQVQRMVDDMANALGTDRVLPGYLSAGGAQHPAMDQSLYAAGVRYRLSTQGEPVYGVPFFQGIPGEKPGQRYVVLPRPESRQAPDGHDAGGREVAGALAVDLLGTANDAALAASQRRVSRLLASKAAVAQSTIWQANGAEIAQWWNDKERFQLSTRVAGARMELDVSVLGQSPFSGGALIVMLPRKGVLPQVRGLKTGMPTPDVQPLDEFRALIRFDTLAPGNYSYQLTF